MPLTTSALEQITRPIVAALYPRRYALKNRERLNRLLMLQQLHVNGDDDVQTYAKAIRAWLGAAAQSPTLPARPPCADLSAIRCERGPRQLPHGRARGPSCPCARHRAARLKRQKKVRSRGFEVPRKRSRPRLTVVAARETSTDDPGKIIKYG
jgi:hypothetical protein